MTHPLEAGHHPQLSSVSPVGQEVYADEVRSVVERIPPARVMSYGDVAEHIGAGGPRQVGWVMAHYGEGLPWWRVVRADGSPARCHDGAALHVLREEGTALRPGGSKVDMQRARWTGPLPGDDSDEPALGC